jgi:hypothetical protein
MTRRRAALTLLAAVLLAVPVVAVPATPALGAQASVAGVTVAPSQPAPGERFTVTTTIRNAAGGGAFQVEDVAVRERDGDELRRVSNLGTLPGGASMDVPLALSFAETGVYDLRVFVYGEGAGGANVELQYPVVVTVRRGGPQVSVETGDAVVGAETPTTVTLVNGEEQSVRNVRLSLQSPTADVDDPTRVFPSLGPGAVQTASFELTPTATAGELTATLRYTTATGDRRTVTERVSLAAESLRTDVAVAAEVAEDGARPPVRVDVSNFGNAPLRDVEVRATDGGTTVARRSLGDVDASETRRTRLNVTGVSEADLRVVAVYETGGQTGEAATTVAYAANPGRVELTGVDYEFEDDSLHITGSASNVGLSDVDGVVVRVLPAAGVSPARPYREYFVGTVPASDFVSFDLYADLAPDATTVPVEVTYIADGGRTTEVQELDVSDLSRPTDGSRGGGSGLPSLPVLVAGVVAAVVVVAIAVYALLNR